MNIIFGEEIAEQVRVRNVALELETFHVEGKGPVTAYCVIMPESIAATELPDVDRICRLHQAVIDAWNIQDYNAVLEGIKHVKGSFAGEADSFYETLEDRIKANKLV